ncbi:MAG: hypothetical protein A2Z88_02195 [Omnitrophica WOR_2 bacterium GWA2_47_8]|nr:MAG: hypothetical protein A2Z88_02195 [Omnitrophica WOR_2 bacterium GWA2_47_8]
MKKKSPQRPSGTPVIINKDGSLNIERPHDPGKFFSDLHHYLLSISWSEFFIILITMFLLGNLFFASMYFLLPSDALQGVYPEMTLQRFRDCFFFSVHLLNGPFTPVGFRANALVTLENYLGMLTLVIATGLFYARFARPTARVVFSENAIISKYNGRPCFIFRVANERMNQIIEARMMLTFTRNETSKEGETTRKFHNLKLDCDYSPLFALSWTIRHFIDGDSVMVGMDGEQLKEQQVVIFASLSGLDDTFSQTITARNAYRYDEIVYNKRFKDIIVFERNKFRLNIKGIHDMV